MGREGDRESKARTLTVIALAAVCARRPEVADAPGTTIPQAGAREQPDG
jgi:hypothetical protein